MVNVLFSLFFNFTRTVGGRRLLQEWLNQPLNDVQMIQERSDAIRTVPPELPIDEEELDFIEYYLSLEDNPTSYSRFNAFFMVIWRKFRAGNTLLSAEVNFWLTF